MGYCGCGEGFGDYRMPGPEGTVYTVRVYQPCDYCETPGAVILLRVSGDDLQFAEDLPGVEWSKMSETMADAWFSLFHPAAVKKAIASVLVGYSPDEGMLDQNDADVLSDEAVDILMRSPMGWLGVNEGRRSPMDKPEDLAALTLPATLPGLLRPGSVAWWNGLYGKRRHCVIGHVWEGGARVFVVGPMPGNPDDHRTREGMLDALHLDLTDATGRTHAAWFCPAGQGYHERTHGQFTQPSDPWIWVNGHLYYARRDAAPDLSTGSIHVPALAELDPEDPRILPDGSRWVDAEALRRVALHVAHTGGLLGSGPHHPMNPPPGWGDPPVYVPFNASAGRYVVDEVPNDEGCPECEGDGGPEGAPNECTVCYGTNDPTEGARRADFLINEAREVAGA